MLRILLTAFLIVGFMAAVKDGRLINRAGLTGSCSSVVPPAGQSGVWKACSAGRLEGRPDLSRQACTVAGLVGKLEYWHCPASVASSRGS
ncbi:MAG: hypothetical protein ACR2MU_03360 [Gaiellaceae bacterium]